MNWEGSDCMDLYKSIAQGLNEAIDYEKGNKKKANKSIIEIAQLPEYHGQQVKDIRLKKHLSQVAFAKVLGVSVKAVEAWEADRNIPSGPVQRFLDMLEKDDQLLEKNQIVMMK